MLSALSIVDFPSGGLELLSSGGLELVHEPIVFVLFNNDTPLCALKFIN